MKYWLMFLVAVCASALGTAISDTFVCGFICGVVALDINRTIDRRIA